MITNVKSLKPYKCIEVEIPRQCKIEPVDENIFGIQNIIITGKKIVDKTQDIIPKTSVNNKDEGNFKINIKLDSNSFQLSKKSQIKNNLKKNLKMVLVTFILNQ